MSHKIYRSPSKNLSAVSLLDKVSDLIMTFYICISYTVLKFTILSFPFSPLGVPLLWIYIHEFTYYYIHTYFILFMKKIKEYLSMLMFWKASVTLELKSSESSRIPHSDLYILVWKSNIENDLKKNFNTPEATGFEKHGNIQDNLILLSGFIFFLFFL